MEEPAIRLREAKLDDLDVVFGLVDEVQSIHVEAEPAFFHPLEKGDAFEAWFKGLLADPNQHLILAYAGDLAVGFLQYYMGLRPKSIFRAECRLAYVNALVVAEAHRGTGCGSLLLEHVKQEARRAGVEQLGIDFWSFNAAARGCFEKAGFRVKRETMWLDPQHPS